MPLRVVPSPTGLPSKRGPGRMGKTRELFKKIRDTKETFHVNMGKTRDRNGTDLTEAEDIKKRWQKYTKELYKKVLMTQITMMVWSLT